MKQNERRHQPKHPNRKRWPELVSHCTSSAERLAKWQHGIDDQERHPQPLATVNRRGPWARPR